jgi:hypothetical protein
MIAETLLFENCTAGQAPAVTTYLIDHFKICRHIIVVTQIGLNPYYVVLHNYVRI